MKADREIAPVEPRPRIAHERQVHEIAPDQRAWRDGDEWFPVERDRRLVPDSRFRPGLQADAHVVQHQRLASYTLEKRTGHVRPQIGRTISRNVWFSAPRARVRE
jgi:hypothetical protein